MKAITVTQPWATLIADGTKWIETRSWQTHYRGELAIHAAKGWTRADMRFALELFADGVLATRPSQLPHGAIIATVMLERVVPAEGVLLTDLQRRLGDFSTGRFAWYLHEPEMLPTPELVRGRLGLWTWPSA